jgi:hypothetical protein
LGELTVLIISTTPPITYVILVVLGSETDNLFYNQNGVTAGLGSGDQLAILIGITVLGASDFELQA